jgi:hypothetical protein
MAYTYTMIQIPQTIAVQGKGADQAAAAYIENTVNQMASQGWELYRIDPVNIATNPGCLGSLFGQKTSYQTYSVITFRRVA